VVAYGPSKQPLAQTVRRKLLGIICFLEIAATNVHIGGLECEELICEKT
jgi:hypothetical protein